MPDRHVKANEPVMPPSTQQLINMLTQTLQSGTSYEVRDSAETCKKLYLYILKQWLKVIYLVIQVQVKKKVNDELLITLKKCLNILFFPK